VILLGGVGWISSHALDPAAPLASAAKPVRIQVVSLDWKWLFIYPDEQVATVNQLMVPRGVPLEFQLTSATVMNAFFVPQLGSQIYTMPGMTTHLNLMADRPGDFAGLSSHFSGAGFSDMRFLVHSIPPAEYRDWLTQTRREGGTLDAQSFATLAAAPSPAAARSYGSVAPRLFESILTQSAPAVASAPPRTMSPPKED
jgi:cytochrome o ubiquinol oxidase subunit 2